MTAKPGSSNFRRFWASAFAGVTRLRTFYEFIKVALPQIRFDVTLNLEPLNPERLRNLVLVFWDFFLKHTKKFIMCLTLPSYNK
jgi:hypothetical protein